MRDHRPTSTEDVIAESQFKQVQEHAGEILQLNQALQTILPKGTADHCRVANIRNGHLLIDVSSAAIKMKIDYDRLMILNKLRTQGYAKLISVDVGSTLHFIVIDTRKTIGQNARHSLSQQLNH